MKHRIAVIILLSLFSTGSLLAEDVLVEVNVTSVTQDLVYIDAGRNNGLEAGDVITLQPVGGGDIKVTVEAVTASSARCSILSGEGEIPVGTVGTTHVPEVRLKQPDPADPGEKQDVPEHPPWEKPPEEWSEDQPLLGTVTLRHPRDRPTRVRGRIFSSYSTTSDQEVADNTFDLIRVGGRVDVENLFELGGTLHGAGEWYKQEFNLEFSDDVSESQGRVDRLSYELGGNRYDATRIEVGRFYHREFVELGRIDGAEVAYKFDSGNRIGVSAGAVPLPVDDLEYDDDTAASVFGRWVSDVEERFTLGGAFQKSWHDGDADRDLFIGDLNWRATDEVYVNATAWWDYYRSDDDLKSGGLELTELYLSASWYFAPGAGVGLNLSQRLWPQLLSATYSGISADQIENGEQNRIGGWWRKQVGEETRFVLNADQWSDEDDDGFNVETGLLFGNPVTRESELGLYLFLNEAPMIDAYGVRLRWTRRISVALVNASITSAYRDYDPGLDDLIQNSARAGVHVPLSRDWTFSANANKQFGDEQDTTGFDLMLQMRF